MLLGRLGLLPHDRRAPSISHFGPVRPSRWRLLHPVTRAERLPPIFPSPSLLPAVFDSLMVKSPGRAPGCPPCPKHVVSPVSGTVILFTLFKRYSSPPSSSWLFSACPLSHNWGLGALPSRTCYFQESLPPNTWKSPPGSRISYVPGSLTVFSAFERRVIAPVSVFTRNERLIASTDFFWQLFPSCACPLLIRFPKSSPLRLSPVAFPLWKFFFASLLWMPRCQKGLSHSFAIGPFLSEFL